MDDIIIDSYKFNIEYKDKISESPKLDVIDGIRLFPMRVGICRNDAATKAGAYPPGKFQPLTAQEIHIPLIEAYDYCQSPMTLHNGWLYVYSDMGKSVCVYHCINNHYTLVEIKKMANPSGKERMDRFLNRTFDYIPLQSEDVVLLFYTLVKLSDTFIESNYKDAPLQKNNRPGTRFDCKAWVEGTTKSDAMHRMADAGSVWFVTDKLSSEDHSADAIADNFKKRIDAAKVQYSGKKTGLRDVFFLLDDPLGCLEKVVCDLNDARLEHAALIRSIRTGVAPESIKLLLSSTAGKTGSVSGESSLLMDMNLFGHGYGKERLEQIEQAQYIHALALCFYQCVYSKEDNYLKDSGAKALSRDTLEKLLAVAERAQSRVKIENLRKLFVLCVDSSAFTRFCGYFSVETADMASSKEDEEHAGMKFAIQSELIALLRAVIPVPHIKDKGLDLPGKYDSYQDPCGDTIQSIFNAVIGNGNNKVGKLLCDIPTLAGLNLDIARDNGSAYREKDSRKVDIVLSSALLFADNFTNSFWRLAFETRTTKLLIDKFKIDPKESLIEFNKGDVTNYLNKLGRVRQDARIMEGRGIIRMKMDAEGDFTKPVYIKTVAKNPNRYQKLFKRLGCSKAYLGLVSMAQLWSVLDEDWKHDSTRTIVTKSIGFATSVAIIQRRFVEAGMELRKTAVTEKITYELIEHVRTQMTRLGAVGMIADGFNAYIDGRACLDKNDNDAAAFYLIGAFISGGGGIYVLLALIFELPWAGPVGIIAAVTLFVGSIIAGLLLDSEFEAFIKRTVLYEKTLKKLQGEPYKQMCILSMQAMREAPFLIDDYKKGDNRHMKVLADYKYQLEDFMYTQMMLPFFGAEIRYLQDAYLTDPRSLRPIPLFSEVLFTVNSNIAQMAGGLSGIEMRIEFIKSSALKENHKVTLVPQEVAQKRPGSWSSQMYPYNSGPVMTDSCYQYVFRDANPDFSLYGSPSLYALLLIRFVHESGEITPMERGGQPTYLVYRYKIDIPGKLEDSKILLYHKAKTQLEKIFISPYNKGVWNF